MKTAIFIDGKNFYTSFRAQVAGRQILWRKFSQWVLEQAGGTVLTGCHYYTGIETGPESGEREWAQERLIKFLDHLEHVPGFFVYRFPRKAKTIVCAKCGEETRFTQEKEVDTTMVADMLRLAAVNAFEVAILISGDADHAPAVEGLRSLGRIVYVATWGAHGLAKRLRKAAFDHIDLFAGLEHFSPPEEISEPALPQQPPASAAVASPSVDVSHASAPVPLEPARMSTFGIEATPTAVVLTVSAEIQPAPTGGSAESPLPATELSSLEQGVLDALAAAEKHFANSQGRYVGVSYFLNRWRHPALASEMYSERKRALDRLVARKFVELYVASNGDRALRVARRDDS